ncbi:hypothetical protein [Henriciella marina]|uniref:hypothetical protein n=1 Tax=Henriciella marina TaxID=453851 RepID=UPI0003A3D529|nr:hypothetical protein [Henriciella marina]
MKQMEKKTANSLRKLVSLKRQRAEQAMAEAQAALDRARADLIAMREALQAPAQPLDFAAVSMAERNGHSSQLIGKVRAQERLVAERQAELATATEILRQAFGSQQLLDSTLREAG